MQYWAGRGYFVIFCNPAGSDGRGDFMNILGLLRGRAILAPDGHPLAVDTAPAECTLRVDLDHDTGELLLDLRTALPGLREGERPAYWLAGHAACA